MKRRAATILVVDDDPLNLKMVKAHLEPLGYCVLEARDGSEALKKAQEKPDLILLDIMMPGISGFETCRSLKANDNTKDIPVIFLSLLQEPEAKNSGFQAGGVDYVTKPFDRRELLARVKTHLTIRKQELQLKNYANKLEQMVQARTQQLVEAERLVQQEMQRSMENMLKTLEGTIEAMAQVIERRDPYTAGHQRAVADLAAAIAAEMGLSEKQIKGIRLTGFIHDIGKMSVPADILSKPGKLSENEFYLIKDHAHAGYEILKGIESPWPVAQTVLEHHERFDGSGYPQGLSGENILLEARVLGVADVVEAMGSHRPYRPALGTGAALEEISRKKGILYDPKIAEACIRLFTEKGYKLKNTGKDSLGKCYLIVKNGNLENRIFPVAENMKIGRSKLNDICLVDGRVSRFHAAVHASDDGKVVIEDLASSNGTLVNGERVKKTVLSHNDIITVGDISLEFCHEAEQTNLGSTLTDTQDWRTAL